MAKAQFHRQQRVWVEAVGAWAVVERLTPTWSKGFDEPVRITYDVGLGREFQGHELRAEASAEGPETGEWRILRARNKWQAPEDCAHHPEPGTFPVVVTDPKDWGGWRTPGAEYDRDPQQIERQARLIAASPKLLELAREMVAAVADAPEDAPPEMQALARKAAMLMRGVTAEPAVCWWWTAKSPDTPPHKGRGRPLPIAAPPSPAAPPAIPAPVGAGG